MTGRDAWVDGGFEEVCVGVSGMDALAGALAAVGGYTVERLASAPAADFPGAAAHCTEIEQTLLTAENDHRGRIRLLCFKGARGIPVRAGARSWDPGGIFDIGMHVADIEESWRALLARGWHSIGCPVAYEWGGFSVKQVIVHGPDGITLSLMEPTIKSGTAFPSFTRWSRTFNCAQSVADYQAAMTFYRDVLGWKPLVDTVVTDVDEPGREVLGLPMPWGRGEPRRIGIVHPDGSNDGSIEIFSFPDVVGRSYAGAGIAPNLGALSTRFRVVGIEEYRRLLEARGGRPSSLRAIAFAPFGSASSFHIVSPDGAIVEFFEPRQGWLQRSS